jgi:hypothetical protein
MTDASEGSDLMGVAAEMAGVRFFRKLRSCAGWTPVQTEEDARIGCDECGWELLFKVPVSRRILRTSKGSLTEARNSSSTPAEMLATSWASSIASGGHRGGGKRSRGEKKRTRSFNHYPFGYLSGFAPEDAAYRQCRIWSRVCTLERF